MRALRTLPRALFGLVMLAAIGVGVWQLTHTPNAKTASAAARDMPDVVYSAYGLTEWQWVGAREDAHKPAHTVWQASTITHLVSSKAAPIANTHAMNVAWQREGMAVRADMATGDGGTWRLAGNVVAANNDSVLHTEQLHYADGIAHTTRSVHWRTKASRRDNTVQGAMTEADGATFWLEGENAGTMRLDGRVHTHIVPSP